MKFNEYPYHRIDFNLLFRQADEVIARMCEASDFSAFRLAVSEFNRILKQVHSMATIASIRNSIDTTDAYYEAEQHYYDERMPEFEAGFESLLQ